MNKKKATTLHSLLNAQTPQGIPVAAQSHMWKTVKKAYNRLSSVDRHPDRLAAALERAMGEIVKKPTK